MKSYLILPLLLLSLCSRGQKSKALTLTKPQYYKAGMDCAIHFYDSVLHHYEQIRMNGKETEEQFLKYNSDNETKYRDQQQKVAIIADRWIALEAEKPGKNIRNVLNLVATGKPGAALQLMKDKFDAKKADQAERQFYIELCVLNCDDRAAMQQLHDLADPNTANTELFFYNAPLLLSAYNQAFVDDWQARMQRFLTTDTTALVEAKMLMSKIYAYSKDANAAKSALIEARYLLEHIAKRTEIQQAMYADVVEQMSSLQLAANDFDNAFANSKNSVALSEQLNDNVRLATAYHTLALIYKRGGANKEADSLYRKDSVLYEELTRVDPYLYEPQYLSVLDEYGEVKKFFDKNDEYDKMMRRTAEMRRTMSETNYPFFLLDYAHNLNNLAQKIMNFDVKVFIAEEQWLKAKDVLVPLNARHAMIAGVEMCNVYYKLTGVKSALKKPDEALLIAQKSLEVREKLYQLAPTANTKEMMSQLIQNANLNLVKQKNKDLAIEQLNKAINLAIRLDDKRILDEVLKFKEQVLKN